jgi:hypothetical protein
MREFPDLIPHDQCAEVFVSGGLRALPGERSGTAALAMSKSLESQRRKDSVGGTWPRQIMQTKPGLGSTLLFFLLFRWSFQIIVTRERSV